MATLISVEKSKFFGQSNANTEVYYTAVLRFAKDSNGLNPLLSFAFGNNAQYVISVDVAAWARAQAEFAPFVKIDDDNNVVIQADMVDKVFAAFHTAANAQSWAMVNCYDIVIADLNLRYNGRLVEMVSISEVTDAASVMHVASHLPLAEAKNQLYAQINSGITHGRYTPVFNDTSNATTNADSDTI